MIEKGKDVEFIEREIWFPCRSMWPAAAAGLVGISIGRVFECESRRERAAPTAMWIWAAGSAARRTMCWCLMPISIC